MPCLLHGSLQLSPIAWTAVTCPWLMKLWCLFCLSLPRWYEDTLSQSLPWLPPLSQCPSCWSMPLVISPFRLMGGRCLSQV